MAGEREAFLAALRERPDDHATTLVFADWLEENGEAEHAEFVRLQARASLADDDPSKASEGLPDEARRAFTTRTDGLRRRLKLPESVAWALECEWHNGFLASLSLPVQWLVEGEKELEPDAPLLRKLTVGRVNGWGERLAAVPLLRHVTELEVQAWISPADARAISASPHLKGLRTLEVWLDNVEGGDEETLAAFCDGVASAYPHLTELRLIGVPGTSPERLTEANRLMGREIAAAPVMLPRLFPIEGDFRLWHFAGHLPDGTQVFVEVPRDEADHGRIFRFDPTGRQTGLHLLPLPNPCRRLPTDNNDWDHTARVKEHLRTSIGFKEGLIRILDIDDPEWIYSVEPCSRFQGEDEPGTPDPRDERPESDSEIAPGRAHRFGYWFRYGAYVFWNGGGDWYVGPDGTVEST